MATKAIPCFVLLSLAFLSTQVQSADFDIRQFGAKADGRSDVNSALTKAFKAACSAPGVNKVIVPPGKYFLSPVALAGPCKGALTLQFDGQALAPSDPSYFKTDGWVVFRYLDRFTLTGKGSFNGQGNSAWTQNICHKSNTCKVLPTNMRLDFLSNSKINGISSIDSKMFHFNILGARNLTLSSITIRAPKESRNTDGIHIGRSEGVTVNGADIQTGDDCISIGDGTRGLSVTGVRCGPGHGISVGSLGKYPNEAPVVGVTVRNCTFTRTMWGVRVKTWPGSTVGRASELHFDDILMNDVDTPVLIDQQYCPWNNCKAGVPSRVKVSGVSFTNIRGSTTTQNAVQLKCSPSLPCEQVRLSNIALTHNGGPSVATCLNVKPTIAGQVPKGC